MEKFIKQIAGEAGIAILKKFGKVEALNKKSRAETLTLLFNVSE